MMRYDSYCYSKLKIRQPSLIALLTVEEKKADFCAILI